MAKTSGIFICRACGKRTTGYYGICPGCKQFDTLEEQTPQPKRKGARRASASVQTPTALRLTDIDDKQDQRWRMPTSEFNRVLGGGLVPGSLILLAGEPGIGKSTLVMEMAAQLSESVGEALYVSGEESAAQIKMRARRLGLAAAGLYILAETNLGAILAAIDEHKPKLVVIDSIQTTSSDDLKASPGLVAQVRECAMKLGEFAKANGVCILLIGHVTKDGSIAGPRVLEHIVDAVLLLEGDPFQHFRLLRGVKNRFGATSEVGVFEMSGRGMAPVENPSLAFLEERVVDAPGSAIAITLEGTRPLLVELQALTSPSPFGNPRRTPNGVDINRLLLISAVLGKRLGLKLWEQDIFVNVIGGIKISEPASDLAMALAIASSYYDRPVPADLAIVGEIGLSGEIRRVSQLGARLSEAAKIGFKRALLPKMRREQIDVPPGLGLIQARSLSEALEKTLLAD